MVPNQRADKCGVEGRGGGVKTRAMATAASQLLLPLRELPRPAAQGLLPWSSNHPEWEVQDLRRRVEREYGITSAQKRE